MSSTVEAILRGRDDGWTIRFDAAIATLSLHDDDEALASLRDATAPVRAAVTSRVPAALFLPCVDLDLGWTLTLFPLDGTVHLHNPFGRNVAGLRRDLGLGLINALRRAVDISVGG